MNYEIEIFRFHLTEPTKKILMTVNQWKSYKKQEDYTYVAYQVGWNQTIVKC
jgi:hypothetical protein